MQFNPQITMEVTSSYGSDRQDSFSSQELFLIQERINDPDCRRLNPKYEQSDGLKKNKSRHVKNRPQ
jgi:hypothetical protein